MSERKKVANVVALRPEPEKKKPARAPRRRTLEAESLTLRVDERIEIQCGRARIILTKDGKILINGAHVSVGSDGVLRLDGGAVQIN